MVTESILWSYGESMVLGGVFSPRTLSSVPFLFFVPQKKTGQERSYQLKGDHLQYIGLYIHIPNQEGLNAAATQSKIWLKTLGTRMVPGWFSRS